MKNNLWVNAARELAKRLHAGQKDKAGIDYFEGHLTSVASMGNNWKEIVCGYLHDACEDTQHTLSEIMELLEKETGQRLSEQEHQELNQALSLLNHKLTPDRKTYIRKISINPLATVVKKNDLTHNMDLNRLTNPSEKDLQRIAQYKEEFEFLTSNG